MNDTKQLSDELETLSNKAGNLINREYWFPLTLFGVLYLGAAVTFSVWDPATTQSWLFWAILGPLGGIATAAWFGTKSHNLGIETKNPIVYAALGISCALACGLIGALADDLWIYPAILCVVGILNIALGFIDGSSLIIVVGAGLTAMGLIGGLGEIGSVEFSLLAGSFMLISALAHRLNR